MHRREIEMEDFTFSAEYARFIMPSIEELEEERYVASLSRVERELYYVRQDYLDGKIDRDRYEGAVECSLWWAANNKEISDHEYERLYKKYMG